MIAVTNGSVTFDMITELSTSPVKMRKKKEIKVKMISSTVK